MSRDTSFNNTQVTGSITVPSFSLSNTGNRSLPIQGSLMYNTDNNLLYVSPGPGGSWTAVGNGVVTGPIHVTDTTPSTSCDSGCITAGGGFGVGGNVNICGTLAVAGGTTLSGQSAITDSAVSTSPTTGALVVTGGVGIGGSLNIAGALVAGTIRATQLATTGTDVLLSGDIPPIVGQVLTATSPTTANWQTPGSSTNASGLITTSTVVNVSLSSAPTPGQVLTATNAGAAIWQTPSSSGSIVYDGTFAIENTADHSKSMNFSLGSMITGKQLTLAAQQATSQTLSFPNITGPDTLVTTNLAQTLTSKNITDSGSNITARGLAYDGNGGGAGTVNVYTTVTAPTAGQVLTAINGTAAQWQTPSSGGTTFYDDSFVVENVSDHTKALNLSLGSMTTGTELTLSAQQTTSQTLSFPNITAPDTVVTAAATQTLTNKTITGTSGASTTNTVTANSLYTNTGIVTLGTATAPSAGQVLTALTGTTADWQTPSGGGGPPFYDNTFVIDNVSDNTKQLNFSLAGMSTGVELTLTSSQSTNGLTLSFPNISISDTIVSQAATQTLTNKTITGTSGASTTNTVTANSLYTNTGIVTLGTATAPSAGQVLTALSGTTADWQPSSGLTTESSYIVPMPLASTGARGTPANHQIFVGALYRLDVPVIASNAIVYVNGADAGTFVTLAFYQSADGTGNTSSPWNQTTYGNGSVTGGASRTVALNNSPVTFKSGYLAVMWAMSGLDSAPELWANTNSIVFLNDVVPAGRPISSFTTSTAYSTTGPPSLDVTTTTSTYTVDVAIIFALTS